jgi:hypothetical protein
MACCRVALVLAIVLLLEVFSEGIDDGVKVMGHKAVFLQDASLEGLMPATP